MADLADKLTDLVWWDQRVSFRVFKAADSSPALMVQCLLPHLPSFLQTRTAVLVTLHQ